jgi:23S rRNA (pseudouridine1915-N3)-methyltransferase
MQLLFISVGKKHEKTIVQGIEEYTARIDRWFKTEWRLILSSSMEDETEKIMKIFQPGDFIIALDERGKELSTKELSQFIEKRMIAGDKRIVCIIGGSYGFDEKILEKAHFKWSLSKLTFPHQLVRLIMAEALYRGISLLKNEPYHHE